MSQLHSDIIKGVLDLSTLDPHDRGILEGSLADSFNSDNEHQLAALTLAALLDLREKQKPVSAIERHVLGSFLTPMHHQPTFTTGPSPQDGNHNPTQADPVSADNLPSSSGDEQTIKCIASQLQDVTMSTETPNKEVFEPMKKDRKPQQLTKAIKNDFSADNSLLHDLTAEEFQKTYPYGMKQILKAGWAPGKGLGADGTGISTPLQHSSPDRQSRAGIGHHCPNPRNDEVEVYNEEYYRRINHDWSDCLGAASYNTIQDNPSQEPMVAEKPPPVEQWQSFSKRPSDRVQTVGDTSGEDSNLTRDLRLVHSQRHLIPASVRGREHVTVQSSYAHQDIQQDHLWNIQEPTQSNRKSRNDRWPRTDLKDADRIATRAAASDQADGHADARANQIHEPVWVNTFEQNLPSHPAERKHSRWPRSGW